MSKCGRYLLKNLDLSIGLNGSREGDEFQLEIFQERRRRLTLNRTRYLFKYGKEFQFDTIKAEFVLPEFSLAQSEYELVLVVDKTDNIQNHKSRYLMRSLGEQPFRLNGVYSFESFLERGDVLDLGFNRLHFTKPQSTEVSVFPISTNIIKSAMNILIEGETGTGKTTLAKEIHEESARRGSFVHLNLASFSSSLLESELFGHVKGAFTGAIVAKKGAILEAHRGTLFLDEIDSISIDLQTKLLLFLDNNTFRAVGGESAVTADVRLIFASGTSLIKKVQEEKMRKDFYFRLNSGAFLRLNSLKDNLQAIEKFCLDFEKLNMLSIDPQLINFYKTCPWPGNFRQLKSHLEKKKIVSNGRKLKQDSTDDELCTSFYFKMLERDEETQSLEEMKLQYCHDAFNRYEKNLFQTSKALKISYNTLKNYLEKFVEKKSIEEPSEKLRDNNVVYINL